MDAHGRKLICTIATTDQQGRSTSIGESLLCSGLSYPLPEEPANYAAAFAQAEASQSSIFGVFHPSLVCSVEASPAQLGPSHRAVELQYGGESYKVSNRSCLRSASHVIVWESREEDAGQGAFIRSCPPHLHTNPFIKQGSVLCIYGREPISNAELLQLPPDHLEYTLSIECGAGHYDSFAYNGENVGRYINQGGLKQAFALMLRLARSPGPFQFSAVEDKAQSHCNCRFSRRRHFGAVVAAQADMELGPTPTELLVNYGIQSYWLDVFARQSEDPGLQHPLVRTVLWCATSPESCWPQHLSHTEFLKTSPLTSLPLKLQHSINMPTPTQLHYEHITRASLVLCTTIATYTYAAQQQEPSLTLLLLQSIVVMLIVHRSLYYTQLLLCLLCTGLFIILNSC